MRSEVGLALGRYQYRPESNPANPQEPEKSSHPPPNWTFRANHIRDLFDQGSYDSYKVYSFDFYEVRPFSLKILGRHPILSWNLSGQECRLSVTRNYSCLKKVGQNWVKKQKEMVVQMSRKFKIRAKSLKNYCDKNFVAIFKTTLVGSWIEKFPLLRGLISTSGRIHFKR